MVVETGFLIAKSSIQNGRESMSGGMNTFSNTITSIMLPSIQTTHRPGTSVATPATGVMWSGITTFIIAGTPNG